jgi:S1-C subfamily serine protease
MKKALIFFVLFFLAFLFYFPIYKESKIKKMCFYPSICVFNPDFGSVGSGVVVRSEDFGNYYYNVAITCEHILLDDNRLFPTGYRVKVPIFKKNKIINYNEYPCVIYEKNKEYDLAIVLFFTNYKMDCAEINFDSKLDVNDKILKVGYGLGDDLRIDHGNITSIDGKLNNSKNLYRMNAFSIFGDSGGPVFYNEKLIGITKGIRTAEDLPLFFISFATSIKNLKIWQKELNNIDFTYDKNKKLPLLPIYFLEFSYWNVKKEGS